MANVINTNMSALNAQRQLNFNQPQLLNSMQQLSSGLRINSAKDDAAGLAIAMKFLSQIEGMGQAMRNASDGISLAQVAEGAMDEVTGNLQRMRELAVQASNGTYSSSDRASIQKEIQSLQSEIDRNIQGTTFNGTQVLAQNGTLDFLVGANGDTASRISVDTRNLGEASKTGIGSALGNALSVTTQAGARNAVSMIDSMLDRVSSARADFGVVQNRFMSSIRNLANSTENTQASNSRIMDADYAQQTAEMTKALIKNQAGVAMLGQANVTPQFVMTLLGQ